MTITELLRDKLPPHPSDFADQVGVSLSTVYRWLSGIVPARTKIKLIARALDMSSEDIEAAIDASEAVV